MRTGGYECRFKNMELIYQNNVSFFVMVSAIREERLQIQSATFIAHATKSRQLCFLTDISHILVNS